jgi:hypothetical protein
MLATGGVFLAGAASGQHLDAGVPSTTVQPGVTGSTLAVQPNPLANWRPDPEQAAALAMLPSDVESQRKELVRLARIPLPSYEERLKLEYLMGSIFPDKHPLRKNKAFLIDHYRSQGAPSQAELDELIASLKKRLI